MTDIVVFKLWDGKQLILACDINTMSIYDLLSIFKNRNGLQINNGPPRIYYYFENMNRTITDRDFNSKLVDLGFNNINQLEPYRFEHDLSKIIFRDPISIFVILDRKTIKINIGKEAKCEDICKIIAHKEDISIYDLFLIYKTKPLDMRRKIIDYGIDHNDNIFSIYIDHSEKCNGCNIKN